MFRNFRLIRARRSALSALALALAGTAPAVAQTAPPEGGKPVARSDVPVSTRMGMHVSALVLEDLRQYVTDDEKLGAMSLRMVILAKPEAIGASCAAYELDKDRMAVLILRTMKPLSDGVEKDVAISHLQRASAAS